MSDKPIIVVAIGDPGGIGPEILCKVIASGEIQPQAIPVAIGSIEALEMANQVAGTELTFRKVNDVGEAAGAEGCSSPGLSRRMQYVGAAMRPDS